MRITFNVTAIAVTAVAAFGFAGQAMADTKAYGKTHVSVSNLGGTTAADGVNISSHASRFGLKNTTDLDNGMTAVYQAEFQIDMADGAAALSYRNTYAGLKGGFGELIVGYHDNPYKTSTSKMDPFGDTYADYNSVITRDDRTGGMILYRNKFGDIGIALGYSPVNDEDLTAGSVDFKAGPVKVAVAYENTAAAAYSKAGATMNFGAGKASLVYANNDGTAQTYLSGEFGLGGGTKLKAAYGTDGGTGSDALMAVGLSRKLGKKTEVYGLYASGDLSKTMTLATANSGGSAVAVGMVHKF